GEESAAFTGNLPGEVQPGTGVAGEFGEDGIGAFNFRKRWVKRFFVAADVVFGRQTSGLDLNEIARLDGGAAFLCASAEARLDRGALHVNDVGNQFATHVFGEIGQGLALDRAGFGIDDDDGIAGARIV